MTIQPALMTPMVTLTFEVAYAPQRPGQRLLIKSYDLPSCRRVENEVWVARKGSHCENVLKTHAIALLISQKYSGNLSDQGEG